MTQSSRYSNVKMLKLIFMCSTNYVFFCRYFFFFVTIHGQNIDECVDVSPALCQKLAKTGIESLCGNAFLASKCPKTCQKCLPGTIILENVQTKSLMSETDEDECEKQTNNTHLCEEQCIGNDVPCKGICRKEDRVWLCHGMCIDIDEQCNGECYGNDKWACNGKCIGIDFPCYENDEPCFYDGLSKHNQNYSNAGYYHAININVYCPITNNCTKVDDKTCNFSPMQTNDPCQILKDICTDSRLERRTCGDPNYRLCEGPWFGQCILKNSLADGVYDCFDRSDEKKTEKLWLISDAAIDDDRYEGKKSLDFIRQRYGLESCGNTTSEKGLTYRDIVANKDLCIPFYYWCKNIREEDAIPSIKCFDRVCPTDFSTLCENARFWNAVDRRNSSCEFQCTGFYPGQCIPKSNVCDNDTRWNNYGNIENENCRDMSDEVCVDHDKCRAYKYEFCDDRSQCIHSSLFCDGYKNCNDGSDEDPLRCDTIECSHTPTASYSCPHLYTNVTICAQLCNNVEECFSGADEINCNKSLKVTLGFMFSFITIAALVAAIWNSYIILELNKWKNKRKEKIEGSGSKLVLSILKIINSEEEHKQKELEELLTDLHQSTAYSTEITFLANFIRNEFELQKGKDSLRRLYDFELSYHDGNHTVCENCLKRNIGTNYICQYVMDAHYPGMVETKILPESIQSFIHNITTSSNWFKFLKGPKVGFYYLDLAKDITIVFSLCSSVNLWALGFSSFSSQVILMYFLSITLPLLINWCYVAFFHLDEVCGGYRQRITRKRRRSVQFILFILAPFLPGLLIYQTESKSEIIQRCIGEIRNNIREDDEEATAMAGQKYEKVQKLLAEKLKLKNILATMQKCDLLEAVFQMILSVSLLCMNYWAISLTENELQSFFNEDSYQFLAWTLPLLVKKILVTTMNVRSADKNGFAPMVGIFMYGFYGLLSILSRMMLIIIYFAVPLGLFNILSHWIYETVGQTQGLRWREYDENQNPIAFSVFDQETNNYRIINITDITPTLLTNVPYTKYTGLKLGGYLALFTAGIFVHIMLVLVPDIARIFLPNEQKKGQNVIETSSSQIDDYMAVKISEGFMLSFLRSLTTIVIPEPIVDWDDVGGEVEDEIEQNQIIMTYQNRWKRTKKEICVTIGMYTIENGLLIIPILILYMNAMERHQFLESTIGAVKLEKEALNTIWILVVYSITTVTSLPVVQIALLWAYNLYGHPWKRFLASDIQAIDNELIGSMANVSIDSNKEMKQGDERKTVDAMPLNPLLNVSGKIECKATESKSAIEIMLETNETGGTNVNGEIVELSRLERPDSTGQSLRDDFPENELLLRVEPCDVTAKDDITMIKLECGTEEHNRESK